MKGDFTRNTFQRDKHYSSVRMQQGRVQLDADWNEQIDITAYRDRTTHRDIIGNCGGPLGQDEDGNALAGFAIAPAGTDLTISSGRYYVHGILCENEEEDLLITAQDDFPSGVTVPVDPGVYLAYLDVWEQHITALEDDEIREVALGGPDTATRAKVVWQVKLEQVGEPGDAVDCSIFNSAWTPPTSTGLLAARAEEGSDDDRPCIVPPGAGYRRLENQLYRVEIHEGGALDGATFKWSRENGSVVVGWDDQDGNRLVVSSTGRDKVLGFAAEDWVELTDDTRTLLGRPGVLVRLAGVDEEVLIIDPATILDLDDPTATAVDRTAFPRNPKIRRWESEGAESVTIPVENEGWIELEDGVQIHFQTGAFQTGDYWLIPARTALGDVLWPPDESGDPEFQLRHGIDHYYCPLAVGEFDDGAWGELSDCRNLFPPLTEMLRFFHVSGDGQEALPGQPVPRPLQVGVANGQHAIAGARVQFRVVDGGGRLRGVGEDPCTDFTSGGALAITVETNADGVAECCWRLDAATRSQQVEATLLEIDGKPLVDSDDVPLLTPIRFNANLSTADQVAYDPENCSNLSEATTVQDAIDILCRTQSGCAVTVGRGGTYERLDEAIRDLLGQGQRDICICLLPGDHALADLELLIPADEPELHIQIVGCGLGSRLFLENPVRITGAKSVTLRDLTLEALFPIGDDQGEVALAFDRCAAVTVTACHLGGFITAGESGTMIRRLVRASAAGVLPDLATSWEASEDLRTWTFSLVEGVEMPNGEPFTAQVVEQVLEENRNSLPTYRNSELIDDFTIRVELSTSGRLFLQRVATLPFVVRAVEGEAPQGALLTITNADHVVLRDNILEAALVGSMVPMRALFNQAEIDFLIELFDLPSQGVFDSRVFKKGVLDVAMRLADLSQDERQELAQRIASALSSVIEGEDFTQEEIFSIQKLVFEMGVAEPSLEDLYDVLLDIRRAAIKSHPGVALILGSALELAALQDLDLIAIDRDDYITVESNEIIGILSLYGMPPTVDFVRETFNPNILGALEEQFSQGRIISRNGGFLGTLQLRGNQLVRLAVAQPIFAWLLASVSEGEGPGPFGLFNRYLISDNVIEGDNNWVVVVYQAMNGNEFTMQAAHHRGEIGMVMADSAIYVGNHSGDPDWVLRDISRSNTQSANLDLAIG